MKSGGSRRNERPGEGRIEHTRKREVIKTADWVLDLGPEGGDKGGEIVAEGTPEDIANFPGSYTGGYLKPLLTVVRSDLQVTSARKKRASMREREAAE